MFRLIVFDLDGTLIDSLSDLHVAVNRVVSESGGRALSSAEVARMVGEGARLLVERAVAASGAAVDPGEALPRFLEVYDSLLPGNTRPYPGIPDVLEQAGRAARLAVLTNKPTEATGKILRALGLAPRFAEIIGGDGPFGRKPSPEGLLHLVKSADVRPGEAVLVGDSSVDVQTAHNAGTRVCVARYGFGQATFQAAHLCGDELYVDHPEELVGVLAAPRG